MTQKRTLLWLGAVFALFLLAAAAFKGASTARDGGLEGIFPWQAIKLQRLLTISGIWLTALGGLALSSRRFRSASARLQVPDLVTRHKSRLAAVTLTLLIVGSVVAYGWLSLERHSRFNSTGFDLAIKEQVLWNTSQGRFFASSPEVDNAFADHFQPIMLALLPFYVPMPSPEVLLLAQTICLALGALPLYRLAQRRLNSTGIALAVVAAYLLFPAVGFISRFDFHPEALAVTAFIFAFEALDRGALVSTSVWLVFPLLSKENLGFSVAIFGLYAAVVHRRVRFGLIWALVGLAVSSITMFWLIPTLRQGPSDTLARYGWLGETPGDMLQTLVTRPGYIWQQLAEPNRGLYLLQILVPTGFLALLALPELLLAVPGLAINLLAQHHCQPKIYCQYTVPIVPFVFVAAVVGLQRVKGLLKHRWSWYLIGLSIVPLTMFALAVDNPFTEDQELPAPLAELPNAETVYKALATVPPGASVVTTNAYAPHLARREGLFIIGIPAQRDPPTNPDIVFINLYDQRFMVCEQYREFVSELDIERYGVLFRDSGLIVIQRDGGSNELLRDFVFNWNNCAG